MVLSMKNKEKQAGVVAGVSLVVMAITAGFSYGYSHNKLITGSAEISFSNLIANTSLFYAELSGWGIIFITDIIVALALYHFFRRPSQQISMITAFVRIVYTLVLGIAIIQLFKIIPLINGPGSVQLNVSETIAHIRRFEKLWSIGLVVFGLHLAGLGYLSLKSKSVPKFLGYLLYFGGIAYTFLHGSRQLVLFETKVLDSIEAVLDMPMALAEILLAFWLIYNGFWKSSAKENHRE
jgi:hypothetical protein